MGCLTSGFVCETAAFGFAVEFFTSSLGGFEDAACFGIALPGVDTAASGGFVPGLLDANEVVVCVFLAGVT